MNNKKKIIFIIGAILVVCGALAFFMLPNSPKNSFENEMNKYFADLPPRLVNKNCVMNTVSKTFSNYEKQQIAIHGQIWISNNKPLRQRIIRIIADCSNF